MHLEEVEAVLKLGDSLLDSSPPGLESALQSSLTQMRSQREELRKAEHNWEVEIQASLLSLRGLKDAVRDLRQMVEETDQHLVKMEAEPTKTSLEDVQAQLGVVSVCHQAVCDFCL